MLFPVLQCLLNHSAYLEGYENLFQGEKVHSTEYAIQQALYAVGTAPTRSAALASFEENQHLLKDWRILYADESKAGPLSLRLNFLKKVVYQRYSLGIHYGFWIMMSFHHQIP